MNSKNKKSKKRIRKKVFGIKLPPLEPVSDSVKTIIDVDPHFYSMVDGRPIRPNTSINQYKQNIKDIALKRTVRGFLVDEMLRINREIETERCIYETASRDFSEYQNSFDKFLAYDNNKTIEVMQKSDSLAKELNNQTDEHKKACFELATIKSKLQYIDESLLILLSFENFLHKAAPTLWQKNNHIKLDILHTEIFTPDTDIFREIDKDFVKSKLNGLNEPKLFFKAPEQLVMVFDLLEKQNLNFLLATEQLKSEKKMFLKSFDLMKSTLRQELDFIEKKIHETEATIRQFNNRDQELKKSFLKILSEKLRHLVSSKTALQIFNYVEFAYEQLIAPNETKLSVLDMALRLEREYDNIMLDLTAFDLSEVKIIEKDIYAKGAEEIKEAKIASKFLKDIDKMSKRLESAYEPNRRPVDN